MTEKYSAAVKKLAELQKEKELILANQQNTINIEINLNNEVLVTADCPIGDGENSVIC